jgi:hypothetical protein
LDVERKGLKRLAPQGKLADCHIWPQGEFAAIRVSDT